MRARPSRLLPWVLAAVSCSLGGAVAYVRHEARAHHGATSSPAVRRALSWFAPAVPADLLPIPTLGKCLARLPGLPDVQAIPDFAEADGELRVTWHLPQGQAPWAGIGEARPTTVVRLELEANGVRRTLAFGAHTGQLFARDLSVCRDAPRGGPCGGSELLPAMQGVVSELSMQEWEGYLGRGAVRWMLVRTPSSVLLLKATGMEGLRDADRGLCLGNLWRPLLEITIAPTVIVREEVRLGDPPTTFDCTRSYEEDSRCAG